MFRSIRAQLIGSFLGVSFLVGGVALCVGGQLLYRAFLNEANDRIRLDLNAARVIYRGRVERIETALHSIAQSDELPVAVRRREHHKLIRQLKRISRLFDLDFAGVVGEAGDLICRIGPHPRPNAGRAPENPITHLALRRGKPVSGTVALSQTFLADENPALAKRARIKLVSTPRAYRRKGNEETSGMALAAAIPIRHGAELVGVIYGGVLINRSRYIVDQVRDTVFQHQTYDGRSIGTATIFFGDVRVSTNVLTAGRRRAIGTRVSEAVRQRVLVKGRRWLDRAFVVSDWYITAYEPIRDIYGERIGMLYVGVLEAKYASVRFKALTLLFVLTVLGIAMAIALGYLVSRRIMRPVKELITASEQVSQGNFEPSIGEISSGEIGVLQKTFAEMLGSLREHYQRLKAEGELGLVRTEKQASIGRLAAGVAHEINNPLTGVLTYTHLLLRRRDLTAEVRSDLETIVSQTERVRKIVKGLLDFSRQTKLERERTEVEALLRSATAMIENQALVSGVTLRISSPAALPPITVDRNQLESVLLNMLINAIDATSPGGEIAVTARLSTSADNPRLKGIELAVADTGCGISAEHLDRLFDPFFTTKDVGHGTGLGLAVSFGIVTRHGGTIRVQSEVGRGSTFTIWLPLGEGGT